MALLKYSSLITGASGSIGGLTLSRNRTGNYGRARTKPVNPNTILQVAARSRIEQRTQHWRVTTTGESVSHGTRTPTQWR